MAGHACHLLMGSGAGLGQQMAHFIAGLTEDFVTHYLHRLRQIEREIGRVAADGHQAVAALHFFDAQTEGFVAENQRRRQISAGGGKDFGGEFARAVQGGGQLAFAAGERAAQHGVGQRFGQGGADAGVFQDVGGAGCEHETLFRQPESGGVGRIKARRLGRNRRGHQIGGDQHQAGQPHGFHRPRRRADIGRMAGAAQHHA